MSSELRRKLNLSLFGPPGSGKGSYGKLLSKTLNIPLVSTSDVLRQHANDDHVHMTTGKLVNDKTVSQLLQSHLLEMQEEGGYILDGFPRTRAQIDLMLGTWPQSIQLQGGICLEVPTEVCKSKIMGRRYCSKCGMNFNTSHVSHGLFELPAQLPSHPECADSFHEPNGRLLCEVEHWTIRPDDSCPNIVQERLDIHEQHTTPVLEYFKNNHLPLLTFAPHKGYDDMPRFEHAIEEWLRGWALRRDAG
jgi:adenylate kinase